MKKVIIVHGHGGYANKNWFPWLKSQLEASGVSVQVPNMPGTDAPDFPVWLQHLQQTVGRADEDTYFVGHSLGCATILRYLERLDEGQRVGGAVLVAGFAEPIHFTELDSFTTDSWNDSRIINAANRIVLINSNDDPHVPLEMAERMRDRFGAELVVVNKAGHLNEKSGYTELPLVFEKLTTMMQSGSSNHA